MHAYQMLQFFFFFQRFIPRSIFFLFSEIYTQIAKNSMVMAKPAVLHFGGFELDEKSTLPLSIVNVSTEVIRMHIIPPQTKYFNIKYKKSVSVHI